MPPKKKPLTDDEKYQQSLLPEKELMTLKRRYTEMDRDLVRSQFTRGCKLARNDRIVSIFQQEHEHVLTDLRVATAPEKRQEDKKVAQQIQFLLSEYSFYDDEVTNQKIVIEETEGQIRRVKKRVLELKAKQITDRQHEDRVKHGIKILEAVENKLEVQVRKFCGICSKNRDLREQMHHFMREREFFMVTWNRVIDNLQRGKKIMLDLIEQATIAYDQREEWCKKLYALKHKARKDYQDCGHKMRLLKRKEHYNSKLSEFFAVKSQIRVMRQLRLKEKAKRVRIMIKIREQIAEYKNMIREITDFYGDDEVNDLIRHFRNREEENFSRFRYINDLQSEMETLGDELGYLHLDIDQRRLVNDDRILKQAEKLRDLEEVLENAKKNTEDGDNCLKKINQDLDNMMQGIGNLFRICRAKNDPIIKLLGDNAKIQHYNVLLYLKVLETKVHDIFLKMNYKEKLASDKKKTGGTSHRTLAPAEFEDKKFIFRVDELVDNSPCSLCVERDVVTEVVDCVQLVWNRDRVLHRLEKSLKLPDANTRLHRVSNCTLPKARELMQKRYIR